MPGYTIVLSERNIIWPGVIQGIGLGFVFMPLSTMTFATLTPEMRADGTAIYSLVRSIGISVVQTMLRQHTQIVHSTLVEHISRFNPLLHPSGQGPSTFALAAIDQQITAQATMIGYIDDFKFMMWMPYFRHYLNRHIELDGGEHGPAALNILLKQVGNDRDLQERAVEFAVSAIEARIELFSGMERSLLWDGRAPDADR